MRDWVWCVRWGALPLAVWMTLLPATADAQDTADPQGDPPAKVEQPATPPDRRDQIFFATETESLKPLSRKLVRNILLDQKEIWTSPFRMTKPKAGLWLGFGAATAALIATDNDSSNALRNSAGQVRWGNRVSKIGASYTLIPIVAGFYGWGAWRNDPKAREMSVLGTEALVDSLIVVQLLKVAARRNRPDATEDKGKFFKSGSSFPSGHSMEMWSLASVIAHEYHHYKITPIIAYSLATVVSAARFSAQKHYASDILAGGAMGWFIGRYVYQTHMNHAVHKHSWMRPQIIPMYEPSQRSVGLTLSFGL